MEIVILHSAQVEASRALMDSIQTGYAQLNSPAEHSFAVGDDTATVISKHNKAVERLPNFSGYPTAIFADGRVVSPAPLWPDLVALAATLPPPTPGPRTFTRLEFLNRFTDQELATLKGLEATDPAVGIFWEKCRAAEFISTDDPRTIAGVDQLAADGHITPARADAILGRPA